VELLDAVLTFADAVNNSGQLERRLFLGARATDDEEELAAGRDEEVEADAARIEAAAAAVAAIDMARNGNVQEAQQVLGQNVENLRNIGGLESSGQLRADDLDDLAQSLPALARGGLSTQGSGGASADVAPSRASSPAPAAPEPERRARRVHDRAMQTILGH